MMKGFIFHQQQQQAIEENMSNLTSASGDQASVSSGNPQQYFASQPPSQVQPSAKKKRNLPGNPDPEAEVVALSPKTLMATNRFVCEICNKGFQRDQNLQLHRRGHNLPWKLKQRTNKEVKKKVYVCPEASCVHHDPSRALGDLTGIKKHFCRKHGEKKWKCEKCSKKYAVQSDWKAHSKTCGTREYRCDCGTLFSRRDSFITHRAFCDALAEESARAITGTNNSALLSSQHQPGSSTSHHVNQFDPQNLHSFSLKKEQQSFSLRQEIIPPWLAANDQPISGPPITQGLGLSSAASSIFNAHHQQQEFIHSNPNPSLGPTLHPYHQTVAAPAPHMSATALLQKAAQMGAAISNNKASTSAPSSQSHGRLMIRPHLHHQQQQQEAHVCADSANNITTTAGLGHNLSSREGLESSGGTSFVHGLTPFGNKVATAPPTARGSGILIQEMMNSLSSAASFDDVFKAAGHFNETSHSRNDGHHHQTRDFLGLRPLPQSDILNIAGLGNCINTSSFSSHEQQQQQHTHHSQKPWQDLVS
ncbi:protein indeterminate-domain 7-like isoform X2 [Mangifera indica]|uniref:protein indeterminate-domain 7-like isoform X2 n=1 Tax=Mangifera indica TaxID=29780 RepID=UPI001CFA0CE8|nr:protein indeterminate-domain 7-like isoform X2 [Mangifera indica]